MHLNRGLAELGRRVNAHELMKHGMSAIRSLPPALHLPVIEAFRQAIDYSFLSAAV